MDKQVIISNDKGNVNIKCNYIWIKTYISWISSLTFVLWKFAVTRKANAPALEPYIIAQGVPKLEDAVQNLVVFVEVSLN